MSAQETPTQTVTANPKKAKASKRPAKAKKAATSKKTAKAIYQVSAIKTPDTDQRLVEPLNP